MMRPLRVPIAVSISAMLLAACGRDSTTVIGSSGFVESSSVAESAAGDGRQGRDTTDESSRSVPRVEEYIDPSCASPTRDDQQRCLQAYLATSDLLLDRYYQALILRLKSEAGASSSAAEPPAVERLRNAQRAWLVYRDDACRARTREREGPLWAPMRARCLGEYSARRADELADALARRKTLAPRREPAKAKPSAARRSSTRHTRTHPR